MEVKRHNHHPEEAFQVPQVKVNDSQIVKNTLVNPNKLIQNEYWNLISRARDKRIGPDGISIWNEVNKIMLKNRKSAPV